MSVSAMKSVFEHSTATRGALVLMLALADWADDQGYVIYRRKSERTLAAIARKARLSVKSVIDIVAAQKAAGELAVEHGGAGPGDINLYRITLPGLETEEERAAGLRAGQSPDPTIDDETQDIDAAAGTDIEPGPHLENKGEETSPLVYRPEKGEVSSDKGEAASVKGEVASSPLRNNQEPGDTPLTPQGEAGDPPAPPDGGRSPAAELETLASLPPELAEELRRRLPRSTLISWFSDLRLVARREAGDPARREIARFTTASVLRADTINQRWMSIITEAWTAAYGRGVAIKVDFDIERARESAKAAAAKPAVMGDRPQSSRRGRKRRAG